VNGSGSRLDSVREDVTNKSCWAYVGLNLP
jgi:hypothetical protein